MENVALACVYLEHACVTAMLCLPECQPRFAAIRVISAVFLKDPTKTNIILLRVIPALTSHYYIFVPNSAI